jgi:hypothetical protein
LSVKGGAGKDEDQEREGRFDGHGWTPLSVSAVGVRRTTRGGKAITCPSVQQSGARKAGGVKPACGARAEGGVYKHKRNPRTDPSLRQGRPFLRQGRLKVGHYKTDGKTQIHEGGDGVSEFVGRK